MQPGEPIDPLKPLFPDEITVAILTPRSRSMTAFWAGFVASQGAKC